MGKFSLKLVVRECSRDTMSENSNNWFLITTARKDAAREITNVDPRARTLLLTHSFLCEILDLGCQPNLVRDAISEKPSDWYLIMHSERR